MAELRLAVSCLSGDWQGPVVATLRSRLLFRVVPRVCQACEAMTLWLLVAVADRLQIWLLYRFVDVFLDYQRFHLIFAVFL